MEIIWKRPFTTGCYHEDQTCVEARNVFLKEKNEILFGGTINITWFRVSGVISSINLAIRSALISCLDI